MLAYNRASQIGSAEKLSLIASSWRGYKNDDNCPALSTELTDSWWSLPESRLNPSFVVVIDDSRSIQRCGQTPWSAHSRSAQNLAYCSRLCPSFMLCNLRRTTDGSNFDAARINFTLPWSTQLLRYFFLKIWTTVVSPNWNGNWIGYET